MMRINGLNEDRKLSLKVSPAVYGSLERSITVVVVVIVVVVVVVVVAVVRRSSC